MSLKRTLQPGETLIIEGEFGSEAYLIRDGEVVVSALRNGKPLTLATLSKGQVVGEMALVDEKPRSATVTALTMCSVEVIPRERFLDILREDGDLAIELLKVLFERLRNAQSDLLNQDDQPPSPTPPLAPPSGQHSNANSLHLSGMNDFSRKALPEGGVDIRRFPFLIGRANPDPLIHNDLSIIDEKPFQISRSHAAIILNNGHPAIMDRGSHLGLEINGIAMGGLEGKDGLHYLDPEGNELCLGGADSSYWFEVTFV